VLPLLRRMETDLDFGAAAYHGDAGPIPVMRPAGPDFLPVDEAFRQAALAMGHPWAPDHNAPRTHGLSPYAFNGRAGRRVSTNDAYLEPARERPNLTVRGEVVVDRVLIERGRAAGVSALSAGGTEQFRAAAVVLCAGAVHSPAILLRSGIGPAADLRALGIEVQADLPAGAGLQDHPLVSLMVQLRPGAHKQAAGTRHGRYCVRFGLGLTAEPADGMLCLLSHADAPDQCEIFGWLNRTLSQGQVRLASADPRQDPVVEQNLLSDPDDMRRMLAMIGHIAELSRHPALREVTVSARLAPGAGATEGLPLLGEEASEAELTRFVLANVYDAAHISGSCRMGAPGDPGSVVDEEGRVLGVDGLRVADASIFPWVPSANTHLSAVLVGEKIADLMRGEVT
jgi:choline dehydrogenase